MNKFNPSKEEGGTVPCQCGGNGLGVNGYHYPGAYGCCLRPSPPETEPLAICVDDPPFGDIRSLLHCDWAY